MQLISCTPGAWMWLRVWSRGPGKRIRTRCGHSSRPCVGLREARNKMATAKVQSEIAKSRSLAPLRMTKQTRKTKPDVAPAGRFGVYGGRYVPETLMAALDRKSTRLNSSHSSISYAVFCLKKKKKKT